MNFVAHSIFTYKSIYMFTYCRKSYYCEKNIPNWCHTPLESYDSPLSNGVWLEIGWSSQFWAICSLVWPTQYFDKIESFVSDWKLVSFEVQGIETDWLTLILSLNGYLFISWKLAFHNVSKSFFFISRQLSHLKQSQVWWVTPKKIKNFENGLEQQFYSLNGILASLNNIIYRILRFRRHFSGIILYCLTCRNNCPCLAL